MSKPAFNPNAPYEVVKPKFDPQKPFEAVDRPAAKPEGIDPKGMATAGALGVSQGLTAGFADEIGGATRGLVDYVQGKLGMRGDISLSDAYYTNRNSLRKMTDTAAEASPKSYIGGQIAGGLATALVPGAGALNASKGAGLIEVVGKGALQGAVSGAGTAREINEVGDEALRGAVIGGAMSGGLTVAGKAVKAASSKLGPILAKVIGGVDETTLKKYTANRARINKVGQLSPDGVKDNIDSAVSKVLSDKNLASEKVSKIEGLINQAYENKTRELVGSATPLNVAKEMTASLEQQKTYLRSLSEQADDALDRSGVMYSKKDLLEAIDSIGVSAGDAIGDEATAALAKLQGTRDRIASQLPNKIPAARLRTALQQIRKDINFDQGSGEFNDSLNAMRKTFTGQISNRLKKDVPEYANHMTRMSDLADNLSTMNRYFGDEVKSLGSLEVLRKGGAKSQIIDDVLRNHAKVNGDNTMTDVLDTLQKNRTMLERINAGEDLRKELFPKAWNALEDSAGERFMAESVAAPIERLSQNRTQSVIRNMGGKIPNIEDRRALEALSKTDDAGTNFLQMIDDKNVFDAFGKGQTNGSRMTALGATSGGGLGFLVGGPTGAAVGTSLGGAAGGVLDKYGPALTKKIIDSQANLKILLGSSRDVQRLGMYARPLIQAAQNGNQSLAATHAYLYASEPDYRKRVDNIAPSNAVDRRIQRTGE